MNVYEYVFCSNIRMKTLSERYTFGNNNYFCDDDSIEKVIPKAVKKKLNIYNI